MPLREVCAGCELKSLHLSDGEARLVGHIMLEGQYANADSRREGDLRRVASTALDYFDSSTKVRAGVQSCMDAHLDGSCELISLNEGTD